ncbi:MAG: hypothetical protein ABIQ93_12750, partial [Saprospiraceae bacterium]
MKTLIFCCKIVACLPLFFLLSCGDTTLPTPTPAPKDQNWYFSPLTASGVGPNGLPTKKIDVKPYCCPPDAIEITSPSDVSDGDLQWVNIPLSLPGGKINSVTVCYQIKGGGAFISQVRLT